MYVWVWPYTGNLNWTNRYTYISNLHRHVLAQKLFCAQCKLKSMNRAHALGVSVGEARRAFARRCSVGLYMEFSDWSWSSHGNLFLVCMNRSTTAGCSQAVQISITTVVEVASGKGHAYKTALIDDRNSVHDFSVKLSSSICSHTDSSCPGCWLIDIWQFLLCASCDKLAGKCAARSGSPHDDKSSH